MKRIPFILSLLLVCVSSMAEENAPTTIIVVRHSEKRTTPTDNPSLSEAGKARTRELVRVISQADIQAVYSSQYARTRETAEPVAQHFSLQVQQVDANKTKDLVSDVLTKYSGKSVLIVGHSNTLPEIVHAFGGPQIADPEDEEYDNLLILFVYAPGKAKLVRLKFGEHWK